MKSILIILITLMLCMSVAAKDTKWGDPDKMTYEDVVNKTYIDPQAKRTKSGDVNTNTIIGKVMCGYQGWFNAEGDGAKRGWYHYNGKNGFQPGSISIDLWPDVKEYPVLYDTPFKNSDGKAAKIFSAFDESTVDTHFRWMKEYGIDGVYMQRFVGEVASKSGLFHFNVVLHNARIAANKYGRTISITYDLSGMNSSGVETVINDWKLLIDKANITQDPAWLKHKGKPVVEIWGIGFNDNRKYTIDDCAAIVDFLQNDPVYGGCFVVAGVPNGWRELNGDCLNDPAMTKLMKKVDSISPWAPGRYNSIETFNTLLETRYSQDMAWCKENDKIYLPVVFPGFSWHNMFPDSATNIIPRLKGDFLWAQYKGYADKNADCIYQAMFDEVDEGTAIFKCTNNPPVGESVFATYDGLPSDYYLKLVGQGKKLINKQTKSKEKPAIK